MTENIKVIKYYDDELEEFVTKEIHLSRNATCEICSKEANKKDFSFYSYSFAKKIYTGCCSDCLPKASCLTTILTSPISLEERILIRNSIKKHFPKVKFKPIEETL